MSFIVIVKDNGSIEVADGETYSTLREAVECAAYFERRSDCEVYSIIEIDDKTGEATNIKGVLGLIEDWIKENIDRDAEGEEAIARWEDKHEHGEA